jgi:hypothetical protein
VELRKEEEMDLVLKKLVSTGRRKVPLYCKPCGIHDHL